MLTENKAGASLKQFSCPWGAFVYSDNGAVTVEVQLNGNTVCTIVGCYSTISAYEQFYYYLWLVHVGMAKHTESAGIVPYDLSNATMEHVEQWYRIGRKISAERNS